jgi:Skp family chaperone for outer membrane proteins
MKHLVKIIVITVTLFISTTNITFAEQKIVVLDLKYVLNNSKAGQGAQDFLKKSFNNNAKKFANIEKSLKEEEKDLIEKKTVLSKEDYIKKSKELREKVMKYQTDRRSSLDKIAKQRAESKEKLLKVLTPIIDEYINTNEISLVIDKKDMLGGLKEYDITKIIVDKLDNKLPSLNLK